MTTSRFDTMLNGMSKTALAALRRDIARRLHAHDGAEAQDLWITVRDILIGHGVSCPEFVPVRLRQWVSNACVGIDEFTDLVNVYYERLGRDDKFSMTRTERVALIRMVTEEYIRGKLAGDEDENVFCYPNAGQVLQQFNQGIRIAALVDRCFPGYGVAVIKSILRGDSGEKILEGLQS